MPWVPLDTHYLRDPKIRAAARMTPFSLSVFPALLAEAMQRAEGGKIEVGYELLATELCISEDEAKKAIEALLNVGVLEPLPTPVQNKCHGLSDLSTTAMRVKFVAWRKWNDRFRKSQERAA